jgi:hypothetical protein
MLRALTRFASAWLVLQMPAWASAEPVRYGVGQPWLTVVNDTVVFDGVDPSIGFDPERGWLNFGGPPPTLDAAGGVTVERDTLIRLDIARTNGLRQATTASGTRYVLEVAGRLPPGFQQHRTIATVVPGDPWRWQVPGVAAPLDIHAETAGALRVASATGGHALEMRLATTEPVKVHAFSLTEPARLVVDVSALPPDAAVPSATQDQVVRKVWPGVTAVERAAATAEAHSRVHEVVLANDARLEVELRAATGESLAVDAQADDPVAAMNAGYYDPATLAPIGLRIVNGEMLSLPSRGRPVLYDGPDGLGIVTPAGLIELWSGPNLLEQARIGESRRFDVAWASGVTFGAAGSQLLRVDASGVVLSNEPGYGTVPTGGMAVRFDPFMASLARLQPGDRLRAAFVLEPPLDQARWAVEAGPSLVRDGRDAYTPSLEAFVEGTRIVSDVTQQAAVALHADGTVRF